MTIERTFVCWGELLWDLFPDGPRLGGTAANVAYHATQLGERAVLVSRVGNDELGRRAVDALSAKGVDTSLVQVDEQAATGTVGVELDGAEPTYRIATQAAWDRINATPAVLEVLARARVFSYGTLAQRTPLAGMALAQALAITPADCVRVCDLNVRLPFVTRDVVDACIRSATAVKLNEAEARLIEQLFGVSDAVTWLADERRIECIALTRGAHGSVLERAGKRVAEPGVPASGGDHVGAGDAFTAVLARELARGSELARIAERANRYAAHVASQPGAMPPIPPELVRSLEA
jgi:fructokinase